MAGAVVRGEHGVLVSGCLALHLRRQRLSEHEGKASMCAGRPQLRTWKISRLLRSAMQQVTPPLSTICRALVKFLSNRNCRLQPAERR